MEAYGNLKYFAEYTWGDRNEHRIEIYDRDYEGEPKKIKLTGDGFVSETGSRDKDIMAPIFTTRGRLFIYDPTNEIRQDLYTIDPKKFTVIHYIKDAETDELDVEFVELEPKQINQGVTFGQNLTKDVTELYINKQINQGVTFGQNLTKTLT